MQIDMLGGPNMASIFSCALPEDLADKLRTLAKDRKVSRNSLLKEGVVLVLEKYKA